ncbi:MAG TPA: hypothetical protein VFZ58_02835 [Candidatus Saccharimonadales bacterium]
MRSHLKGSSLLRSIVKAKFVVAAFVAVAVASFGVAAPTSALSQPSSKEACRNGGWQQLGYRNQGQCVRAAVQNPGSGYGGNTNVNVDIDINVNVIGNNNMVIIVVPPYWS